MKSPLETAVARAAPYLVVGLVAAPLLLAVPLAWSRLFVSVTHLSVVVAFGLVLVMRLSSLAESDWFPDLKWRPTGRRLAGSIALVVTVTGVVALVTLASSAALRLQPSLQFLQMLSALDIAWAAGAVVVGGRRLWSVRNAALAGIAVGVICVMSIWNYLRIVGFTADGGWLLDGGELMRLVIPLDMAVAVVAGTVLYLGTRRPGAA